MTDWVEPIEDCVYNYLYDRWAIDRPKKINLKPKNAAYSNGTHGLWVELKQTVITKADLSSQYWDAVSTLNIFCLMKRSTKGQLDDGLDDIMMHVRTLLIEYNANWIAGIRDFNNFVMTPRILNPDEDRNPWQNTWVSIVQVDCYYQLHTQFARDPADYNPNLHSAGQLTYKLNE